MTCTLGELVDLSVGCAFKSSGFTDEPDGIRLLRGDNVGQGRLRWVSAKLWPVADLKGLDRYLLGEGDVILAMDRPWIRGGLKQATVRSDDLPALLVQRVARLRARPGLDQGFLAAVVASQDFESHILSVITGSAVPHISGSQILSFRLRELPSEMEQRQIGATLEAVGDKIESNRREIDIALSLLDAISSSLALDGTSLPLAGLAEPARDTFEPALLGTTLIDHFSIPAFDATGRPERTRGASVISAKLKVDQASVLVSRLNPETNRTWFAVPEPGVTAGCSTEFLVLKPRAGVTLGSLWLAVRDGGYRSLLAQRVTGTSGSHQRVKPQDALDADVPDVRQMSTADVEAADELLWLVHQRRVEMTRLAELRDALLPELLSGRIRVPEASESIDDALA